MAINKNNFKNAEGNYEAKNTLMDAVIDGVNLKADKEQENWQQATPLNGWTAVTPWPVMFFKDSLGNVHLKGRITGGDASTGTNLFSLPAGYRPTESTILQGITWGATGIQPAFLLVRETGYVNLQLKAMGGIAFNVIFSTN